MLAWMLEHWPRVRLIKNPGSHLFGVGQGRKRKRKTPPVFVRQEWQEPWIEPALEDVYDASVPTGLVETTSASPAGSPALSAPLPHGTTQTPASFVGYPSL
jgi:hypothetical protein